jgi:hypothetical protein
MKLRCTIGSINFVDGRPAVTRGELFEVPETLARQLIAEGDAIEVKEPSKIEEVQERSESTERPKGKRGRR